MKEQVSQEKQQSRTIQGSGRNQQIGFVDNRSQVLSSNHIPSIFQFCGWKTKAIKSKIKAEKSPTKPELTDTAHHILPKKELEEAYKSLTVDEQEAIGEVLTGKKEAPTVNQIKSLPFNLTLGPRPELRDDDPKDSIDPNYSGGVLTPRSAALSKAFDPVSKKIDPKKLKDSFKEASDAHKANPKLDRSTWTKEADGKYTRDKQ